MKDRIKKMVCLGDSFTVGYMVDPDLVWTSILKSRLSKFRIIPRGINGDTTSGMLSRLNRDVIEEKPHYAMIIGGANDIISMSGGVSGGGHTPSVAGPGFDPTMIIKNNTMAMIHQLFDNRVIPIIATHVPCISEMVPPAWSSFYDFSDFNEIIADLNRWRSEFAGSFQCLSMDLFNPMMKVIESDREYAKSLYIDGIHLSAEGHSLIAGEMLKQLDDIIRL